MAKVQTFKDDNGNVIAQEFTNNEGEIFRFEVKEYPIFGYNMNLYRNGKRVFTGEYKYSTFAMCKRQVWNSFCDLYGYDKHTGCRKPTLYFVLFCDLPEGEN